MQSRQLPLPGIPQSLPHGNALQESTLAFTKLEKAAWLALQELQCWHESYLDDEATAQALQALREALTG
jgi:hypothetical protein